MSSDGLNCLHNLESKAVIYEVSKERSTSFFLFLSLFVLVALPSVMDLGCANVVRDSDSISKE